MLQPRLHRLLALLCLTSTLAFAQDSDSKKDESPGINSGLVSSLRLRGIGPAFMSGRIVDIAVDPEVDSTWYIATAAGGAWKTTNAGTTWKPIFDNYGSYSTGCVTVDPKNRFTVWLGTGENNSQRSVGYGDGLYKSVNGGQSFKKVGLENSEHIAKIVVHPDDSDTVFVAAQGPLWSSGGDRGLYKTTDGGKSWTSILNISENTGVTDFVLDPRDSDTIYAASYQRRRHVWTLIDGGPESAIHKTTDGGKTWKKITSGLPGGDLGRIGLAISPMKPDVLYAIVEATKGNSGFFRSANRGESWRKQSSYVSSSPQYYQEIVACPHKFDRIYSLDTYMQVSEDGGRSFSGLGESFKHVDNHAMVIDPNDADHLIIGCDGGLYETWDRGKNYRYTSNLPLSQFYKIAVGTDKPFYYVYGGTQDNATQGGPSQTNNVHGIRNSDWFTTVFGDGFDPLVDPNDPNTIYSQWQYGGLVRFDKRTGQRIDIKPQADKGGPPLRFNWDSALAVSPHDSNTIYYGSQFLHRSKDRGNTWETLGEDLSRQIDRNKLKVMGRVWGIDTVAKNMSTSFYGTIVCAAESPVQKDLLYVGTDDGMVQVSEDGGQTWRKVGTFDGTDVPEFGYIHDIEPCLHDADTVFVAINNHKRGDFKPYIVKSTDRGKTWKSIAKSLPERGSVYTLAQDHVQKELMFCGTEFGLFFTVDGGKKWMQMRNGLPVIAVRDLEIQREHSDLVVGTFGRGMYILDNYDPMRHISEELLKTDAKILPIKKGLVYVQAAPMSGRDKAYQGAGFYTAPNPEFGVTFTYYTKDSVKKTKKSKRKSKESKLKRSGGDVPYPSWDELKEEGREQSEKRMFVIRDSSNEVVNTIPASGSKGMHRTTWNYRYHSLGPITGGRGRGGRGPMALPGKYTVELISVLGGETKTLVEPTEFEIETLNWGDVEPEDRSEILAFQKQTSKLQHAIMAAMQVAGEASERLSSIKQATETTPGLDPALQAKVRELELKMEDIMERFSGDQLRPSYQEPGYPGIMSRISTVVRGHWSTDMAPTTSHKRSYEIAEEEFVEALELMKPLVETEIPALNKQLEEAGARWTPGRPIPDWK
ncbi:MAG: WD40/YVTN/BNR-like repeat-containing protein [Planctomycetaceae bacterium]